MESRKNHNISSNETELTVVIPVYNEAENIEPLFLELFPVLSSLDKNFEVLYIDDASSDGSVSVLEELSKSYSELRMVRHRTNCGQSAAIATGFANARGGVIVTMDGDQQNDPADIPLLLDALKDADAVCGVRRKREDNWIRRISSRIANGFRNWITGDNISDAGCACRAMRRDVLRELPVFNGMHRFLPTLLRLQGYTVTEISVNHRPRIRGISKYGIGNRMFRGIVDCFAIRWWRMRCLPGDRADGEDREG
jgi:dolichol-phosphate mannosyltransferase